MSSLDSIQLTEEQAKELHDKLADWKEIFLKEIEIKDKIALKGESVYFGHDYIGEISDSSEIGKNLISKIVVRKLTDDI